MRRGHGVVVSVFKLRPTPLTGAAERSILLVLRSCSYSGTVERLALLVGFGENWVWRALAGLSARGLAKVEKSAGGVTASITRAGRLAIGGRR